MILSIPCQSEMTKPYREPTKEEHSFRARTAVHHSFSNTNIRISLELSNFFEYLKPELVLEVASDKVTVGVHSHSIPARIRYHYCCNSLSYRVIIRRHMNVKQSIIVNHSVIFIDTPGCATISYEVLSTGRNFLSKVK